MTVLLLLGGWVLVSLGAGAVWARTYPSRRVPREPVFTASPRHSSERVAG